MINNIVIACPEGTWIKDANRWEGTPRELALFYAELLGIRIVREDWLKIAWDDGRRPHLAFGDGPTAGYLPPRSGDPVRPQQVHLEIPARDLQAAGEFAITLGANLLDDRTNHGTYADPVGHPFSLYHDPLDPTVAARPLSGRIGRIVFDCFSPRSLAAFWSGLLEMPRRVEDTPQRMVIARPDDTLPMLGFQHAIVPAPRWPDPKYPQQLHMDVYFEDGKAGQELAGSLGAIRLPEMGGSVPSTLIRPPTRFASASQASEPRRQRAWGRTDGTRCKTLSPGSAAMDRTRTSARTPASLASS